MAEELFATKVQQADANEPGLVLVIADDLSATLVTPDGKVVPVEPGFFALAILVARRN